MGNTAHLDHKKGLDPAEFDKFLSAIPSKITFHEG